MSEMRRPEVKCGTASAERRHRRRGEPIDEACREASRVYQRSRYRYKSVKVDGKYYARKIPTRVLDVVELHEPVDVAELSAFIPGDDVSILRAVVRLVADGALVKVDTTLRLP